jgi:hypothetical protein
VNDGKPIEGRLVDIASAEILDDVAPAFERETTNPPAATHLLIVRNESVLRMIP